MSVEENNVHRLPLHKAHKFFVEDLVRAYSGYYFKLYCSTRIYDPTTSIEILTLKGDTE